jgi:hypothetical protein
LTKGWSIGFEVAEKFDSNAKQLKESSTMRRARPRKTAQGELNNGTWYMADEQFDWKCNLGSHIDKDAK